MNKIKLLFSIEEVNSIIEDLKVNYIKDLSDYSTKMKSTISYFKRKKPKYYNEIKEKCEKSRLNNFKKKCRDAALNCSTKKEFFEKYKREYNNAYKYTKNHDHDFLDNITSHMKAIGNRYKRCIYVIYYPEINSVYIGLTYNIKIREEKHINGNQITSKLIAQGYEYSIKRLTDYISIEKAIEKEIYFIKEYKKKFKVLNISKGGGLGGKPFKLKDKELISLALKYDSYSEFYKNKKLYNNILRRKLLTEVKRNYIKNLKYNKKRKRKRKWNKDKLIRESKKHASYKDLIKNNKPLYFVIVRHKMVKEIRKLFNLTYIPRKNRTNEEIYEIAKEYSSYSNFRKENPKVYDVAKKRKLLKNIRYIFT